ncbi:MAG: BsaWI family type II restriction enzyme [Thermodesulfovibrionales bacterium]|nr:BsaWI family type II restriction enzyme [Thermodesulfovibrionales bacterium]
MRNKFSSWDDTLEKEFKKTIKGYFNNKIEEHLKKSQNYLEVGNNLSHILKSSEEDIVKIITPRAVRKWASKETLSLWESLLKNERMVLELREIGKSIANSMRPLAGNNFALWIAKILNLTFQQEKLPLMAVTSGKIKQNINAMFNAISRQRQHTFKPDIDIVVVNLKYDYQPLVIISAKTTLAERVMQTISWYSYLQTMPDNLRDVKLFLVTAWETFDKSSANRDRVQQLDGVYVCNPDVREFGNIKMFCRIIEDLKALI